jgi:DNA-binding PadR family transcriptional regulator
MTERRDWLIVALSESPTGQLSPVQIQKAMFLFKEGAQSHFEGKQFYDFTAYHFGPFSPDIYYDLEALEQRGLVQIERSDTGKRRAYVITPQGKAAAEQIRAEQHRASGYLGNVARWVQRKSFTALLRYIYRRWPQYRENSIFVDNS